MEYKKYIEIINKNEVNSVFEQGKIDRVFMSTLSRAGYVAPMLQGRYVLMRKIGDVTMKELQQSKLPESKLFELRKETFRVVGKKTHISPFYAIAAFLDDIGSKQFSADDIINSYKTSFPTVQEYLHLLYKAKVLRRIKNNLYVAIKRLEGLYGVSDIIAAAKPKEKKVSINELAKKAKLAGLI